MSENATNSPHMPTMTSRRTVASAAVWSVPVIATVAAAPMAAASVDECASVLDRWMNGVSVNFENLTSSERWIVGTSTMQVAWRPSTTGEPALAVSSDTVGLSASVTSYYLEIVTPYEVIWDLSTVGAGWTLTQTSTSGYERTYRLTADPTVIAVSSPTGSYNTGLVLPVVYGDVVYEAGNPFFERNPVSEPYPYRNNVSYAYTVDLPAPCSDISATWVVEDSVFYDDDGADRYFN